MLLEPNTLFQSPLLINKSATTYLSNIYSLLLKALLDFISNFLLCVSAINLQSNFKTCKNKEENKEFFDTDLHHIINILKKYIKSLS